MPRDLILAADDLSGACELAAGLAGTTGLTGNRVPVLVQLLDGKTDVSHDTEGFLSVYDLDSRSKTKNDVKNLVASLLSQQNSSETRIFLKLDSLLRGRVKEHLETLAESATVVFCPALPALDRLVKAGTLEISSIPLAKTKLWASERRKAPNLVADLFESTKVLRLESRQMQDLGLTRARLGELPAKGKVAIADCASVEELSTLATALALTPGLIAAGSAEFGALFCSKMGIENNESASGPSILGEIIGPSVILVGSKSEQSSQQVKYLESQGVLIHRPQVQTLDLKSLANRLSHSQNQRICITFSPKFLNLGLAKQPESETIRKLLSSRPLVLTGGATARSVLQFLGVKSLRIIGSLGPGQVLAVSNFGIPVAIKPGSFGKYDTLQELANALESIK